MSEPGAEEMKYNLVMSQQEISKALLQLAYNQGRVKHSAFKDVTITIHEVGWFKTKYVAEIEAEAEDE